MYTPPAVRMVAQSTSVTGKCIYVPIVTKRCSYILALIGSPRRFCPHTEVLYTKTFVCGMHGGLSGHGNKKNSLVDF